MNKIDADEEDFTAKTPREERSNTVKIRRRERFVRLVHTLFLGALGVLAVENFSS